MNANEVTQEQDAISLEVQVAAPQERVFRALTDPNQLVKWWGQKGLYHHTKWTADVRAGGAWRSEGVGDQDGAPYNVKGEYLEVDPPRRLVFTWQASWSGPLKTVVAFDLVPITDGTLVRLRHSGFAGAPAAATGHYQGWVRVLGWMQAFAEKGLTVADRPAPPQ